MSAPTPTPPPSPDQPGAGRMLAVSLAISGALTIVVAIVLGATVDPLLYLIALVAVFDFGFAWLYANGRIGPAARRRGAAEASGDAAAVAESDPTYNPYARED